MERIKGVEPSFQAWEAGVLPMNHIRMFCIIAYRVIVFKFFPSPNIVIKTHQTVRFSFEKALQSKYFYILDNVLCADYNNQAFRGVAQMVARLVRDQEAGSSSLPTPTNHRKQHVCGDFFV